MPLSASVNEDSEDSSVDSADVYKSSFQIPAAATWVKRSNCPEGQGPSKAPWDGHLYSSCSRLQSWLLDLSLLWGHGNDLAVCTECRMGLWENGEDGQGSRHPALGGIRDQ